MFDRSLLPPELANTEEDVRKVYPQAVFMPWDDVPLGMKVRIKAHPNDIFEVVGRYEGMRKTHNCPDCSHSEPDTFYGWWKCKDLSSKPFFNSESPIHEVIELHYPPTLIVAE